MIRNTYSNETVNTILDAAFELFMKKGYEGTCVQDIINLLDGFSKDTVYYYFKSKEDILVAITDRAEGYTQMAMAV